MSEASTNPPPEKPSQPPISRGRKWRRRLIILIVILLGLSIAGRVLVSVLLPPVLRKVAGGFGLTASYDKLDLYALSGDVGLWNLRFTPLDGSKPVITSSYCRASISPLALLRGRLAVNRAEAEDAEVVFERNADGTVPLLQHLMGQDQSAATPAPATPSKPTALSLDPPLTIDVLRLQNGRARVHDASVTPATDVSLQLDMIVTNVGSLTEKTRMEMQLYSPEALVALYVNASGTSRNNQLDADLAVKMYGLNLLPAKAYLAPLGIVPVSNNISARMTGHLQAHVNQPPAGSNALASDLAATLALTDLELASDNRPVASVGTVNIDIPSLSPGAIRIAAIDVNRVHASAARTMQGRLSFGGIELVPVAAPATQPSVAVKAPAVAATPSSPPIIELKKFSIKDVALSFDDAAMADPAHIALQASTVAIEHVSTDPAQSSQSATILIEAAAPGIAKTIKITGTAKPAQTVKHLDVTFNATGISPTAAAPYLAAMGLTNNLTAADASCALSAQVENKSDGSLAADFSVKNIRFADGQRDLLGMKGISVTGATVNADASRIKVASIAIDGPTLPIQRDVKGAMSVFGIGLVSKPANTATPPPSTQPAVAQKPTTQPAVAAVPTSSPSVTAVSTTQPSSPAPLPAIEIDQLAWHGASIVLHDLQTNEPLKLSLNEVNVDIAHLLFDPAAKTATPGTIRVSLRAPGVIDRFALDGTITPAADSLAFEINGQSTGISATELKSLLADAGVEPVMHDGSLKFTAAGSIKQSADGLAADLSIRNAALTDGQTKWLSLDAFDIRNASFDDKAVTVDAVRIDKPAVVVTRSSEGLLSIAGFKMLPPKPAAPTTLPSTLPPATPTQIDLSLPLVARLKSFKLNGANLQWNDAAVLPAVNVAATVNVSIDHLAMGEDAAASPFNITLTSPGVIDSLNAAGTFKLAPQTQQVELQLTGTSVYGQSLEPYLPPNAKVDFNNGQFAAKLTAALSPNPAGGSKATLAVTDMQLSDGIAQKPVAGVKSIRVGVDRLDLPGKTIALDELSIDGMQMAITQDEQGLSLFGLTLAPQPLRPVPPPPKPAAEPIAAAQASDVNAILAQSREKPPLITLKTLSIKADRLSFSSPAAGKELAIVNLSLANSTPIELLGNDPARRPPFDLKFNAGVDKLVDSIAINAHLAPLANEPTAKIDLDVSGIHANELTEFLPALKETIDGNDLSNGRFATTIDSHFKFTRRGRVGIDFTRDITTDVSIKKMQVTQAGIDQPLAGVGDIHIDGVRYSPVSGSVVVKSIDIDTPMARVVRDAAGIHALGLTLKTPPPSTQPTTAPAEAAAPPATAPAAVVEAAPSTGPASTAEMRIERFRVTGVDFVFEDHLGTQPTVLPINDLDVDVKGLSTRALKEPKPIRFSAVLGAGKVSLPAVDPKNGETTQDRPVFSEASAAGNVVLVPKPKGFVKVSLSGLEMSAIRGLASQADIQIDRGTFDLRTDVRLEGQDKYDIRVFPTFNELRVSEPPDGLIQRILKLPAPLDAVISALEDSDGSISLPVNIPMNAGHFDMGEVEASAAGSVGRAIGDAMLAAPLKAVNIIASLAGADTTSDRLKAIPPVVIDFAPGESQLTIAQQKVLDTVLEQLRKDDTLDATIQHTLGSADVPLAAQRSNPLATDSLALASRMRAEKSVLQQLQAEQTSRMRVAMASQNPAAVESAMAALRATSIELKDVDDGLEQVLGLLQPGADRQSDRRTKAAAILLGDLRLRALQQAMVESNVKAAAERVHKTNAQYNPDTSNQPGRLTIVLNRRAKT